MNGTNLTVLVVAVIGVISSFVTPKLLGRQAAKRAEETATDVSWVAINQALVAERNKAQGALVEQTRTHAEELLAMRTTHREEMKALSDRLADSQARVGNLYDELRRLRPPST